MKKLTTDWLVAGWYALWVWWCSLVLLELIRPGVVLSVFPVMMGLLILLLGAGILATRDEPRAVGLLVSALFSVILILLLPGPWWLKLCGLAIFFMINYKAND